jgi:hypothetical protein
MKDEFRSAPKIKPHDEEDEFDWKKEIIKAENKSENSSNYIVYPNQKWPKEIKEQLKNKYGFKWVLDHWERKEDIDEDAFNEMFMLGIVIENEIRGE